MTTTKMTYREAVKMFLDFLKENDALEGYKKETLNYRKTMNMPSPNLYEQMNPFVDVQLFNESLFEKGIRNLIMDAFNWTRTNDGAEFWVTLHSKWLRLMDRLGYVELIGEK